MGPPPKILFVFQLGYTHSWSQVSLSRWPVRAQLQHLSRFWTLVVFFVDYLFGRMVLNLFVIISFKLVSACYH